MTYAATNLSPVNHIIVRFPAYSSPKPSAFDRAIKSFCCKVSLSGYSGRTSWLKQVCASGKNEGRSRSRVILKLYIDNKQK